MPAAAGVLAGQKQEKKVKKKVKVLLEPIKEDGNHGSSKFARALGSVDFVTRERGVLALTRFLQRKTDLSESDMLKLWKGLYFCFWHSDKAPVQADLAERLAGVMSSLNPQVAYLYFTVFITTLQREWLSIDKHRLDKFLMLVRKFVAEMLAYLHKHDWQQELVSQYMSFLQSNVLLPQNVNRAVGLTYHVSDIFVPELKRMLAAASQDSGRPATPLAADTLLALLQPFVATLQGAGEEPTIHRVREGVFDPLVEELHQCEDGSDEDEEGEGEEAGTAKLPVLLGGLTHQELAAKLFELGGGVGVKARNRAALYGVSQELERAARKRARRDSQQQQKPQQAGKATYAAAVQGQQPTPKQPAPKQQKQQKHVQGAEAQVMSEDMQAMVAPPTSTTKKAKRAAAAAAAAATGTPVATQAATMELHAADLAPLSQQPGTLGTNGPSQPNSSKKRKADNQPSASQPQQQQQQQQVPVANGHVAGKTWTAEKPVKSAMKVSKAAATAHGVVNATSHASAVEATSSKVPSSVNHMIGNKTAGKQQAGSADKDATHVHWPDGQSTGSKAAQQAGEEGSVPSTPDSVAATAMARHRQHPGEAKEKKSVRINLRKNLYFAFKGPIPDPMTRTPTSCRSKGGILKVTAPPTDVHTKTRPGRALTAPHSAPPKVVMLKVPKSSVGQPTPQEQRNQGVRQRPITPTSIKRARAADFFS